MIRALVVCALVVAACSLPFVDKFDRSYDEDWELYKKVHNKKYTLLGEEVKRRSVWEANLDIINRHNLEHDLGNHTFRLGMNVYGDLTNEEFVARMNGFKQRKDAPQSLRTFVAPYMKLPDTVDWRQKGYVTPVKNQEQCGSCWAFSATGSLEGQMFNKTGVLPDLSEQNLVDCSYVQGDDGCNGGLMDDAFKYVKKNGLDKETCYPYKAKDENTCYFKDTADCIAAHCTGFVDIEAGNEKQLKAASATVGPISVAIDASHSSFQLYTEGVYSEPECSSSELDHGVLVVGYGVDADSGNAYWLVKNSWGETWGMNGYIKMSRNADNQCGIATSASYPLV
ncbi:cathepsin L1-like [Asterias rubens]|uniref:cathepsin L1-like n=1 Tax=Asterias rubens TaxID=7604 RepID=UPI0014554C04|nr:cathepsin L1-like [Asterias rubens]